MLGHALTTPPEARPTSRRGRDCPREVRHETDGCLSHGLIAEIGVQRVGVRRGQDGQLGLQGDEPAPGDLDLDRPKVGAAAECGLFEQDAVGEVGALDAVDDGSALDRDLVRGLLREAMGAEDARGHRQVEDDHIADRPCPVDRA